MTLAIWYHRQKGASKCGCDGWRRRRIITLFFPDSFWISIVLSIIFIHHYPSSSIIHNINLHYRLTTEHIWWFPLSASIHRSSISQCCLSYASEILPTCHYCQIVILVRVLRFGNMTCMIIMEVTNACFHHCPIHTVYNCPTHITHPS